MVMGAKIAKFSPIHTFPIDSADKLGSIKKLVREGGKNMPIARVPYFEWPLASFVSASAYWAVHI